jgi:hypothetical protein
MFKKYFAVVLSLALCLGIFANAYASDYPAVPNMPTNFKAHSVYDSATELNTVTFTWEAPEDNGVSVDWYGIVIGGDFDNLIRIEAPATSYTTEPRTFISDEIAICSYTLNSRQKLYLQSPL